MLDMSHYAHQELLDKLYEDALEEGLEDEEEILAYVEEKLKEKE